MSLDPGAVYGDPFVPLVVPTFIYPYIVVLFFLTAYSSIHPKGNESKANCTVFSRFSFGLQYRGFLPIVSIVAIDHVIAQGRVLEAPTSPLPVLPRMLAWLREDARVSVLLRQGSDLRHKNRQRIPTNTLDLALAPSLDLCVLVFNVDIVSFLQCLSPSCLIFFEPKPS